MTFTYQLLPHFPTVPQHFVDRALEYQQLFNRNKVVYSHLSEQYKNRQLLKNNKIEKSVYQIQYDLGYDFYHWVHENINSSGYECGVAYLDGSWGSTQGAHTDQRRIYSLLYLLEPGGDDTKTVFYREQGQEIIRTTPQSYCDNYDLLDVIDEVQFPVGQWVVLNTQILHGVENVKTRRISLQASTNVLENINV